MHYRAFKNIQLNALALTELLCIFMPRFVAVSFEVTYLAGAGRGSSSSLSLGRAAHRTLRSAKPYRAPLGSLTAQFLAATARVRAAVTRGHIGRYLAMA